MASKVAYQDAFWKPLGQNWCVWQVYVPLRTARDHLYLPLMTSLLPASSLIKTQSSSVKSAFRKINMQIWPTESRLKIWFVLMLRMFTFVMPHAISVGRPAGRLSSPPPHPCKWKEKQTRNLGAESRSLYTGSSGHSLNEDSQRRNALPFKFKQE